MNSAVAKKKSASDEFQELSDSSGNVMGSAAKYEWRWIALVCMLLVISGGIRYGRDWYFESLNRRSEIPLFSLNDFPKELGSWRAEAGAGGILEDEIARIAGANDSLIRTYVDQKSGEKAVVMIIYGLAYRVWNHTPDACYPAVGFKAVPPQGDDKVAIPGTANSAVFRRQNFLMYKSGLRDHREVYFSFRNAGEWGYDMAKNWKIFRYHPGMFKVQVQRQNPGADQLEEDKPVDELLGLIVGEIEGHVADKGPV